MVEAVIAGLVLMWILVYWIISGIDDIVDGIYRAKQDREQYRLVLRKNMNGLIEQLSHEDNPITVQMLDRALQDNIVKYRVYC